MTDNSAQDNSTQAELSQAELSHTGAELSWAELSAHRTSLRCTALLNPFVAALFHFLYIYNTITEQNGYGYGKKTECKL